MPNIRTLIDSEMLLTRLMDRHFESYPQYTVAPDVDVDTIDVLPAVTYSVNSTGDTDHGIDVVTFTVNVFAESIDKAFGLAQEVHNLVWGWEADPESSVVQNVGWVNDVEDVSTFSRVGTVTIMVGKTITQYVGIYTLTLRSNN